MRGAYALIHCSSSSENGKSPRPDTPHPVLAATFSHKGRRAGIATQSAIPPRRLC